MTVQQKVTRLVGCFSRSDRLLALPIQNLQEVVPLDRIHPLPDSAHNVLGSIRLRGQGIPLLDLKNTNDKPPQEQRESTQLCVVIVRHSQRLVGLLADHLLGLFEVNEDEITHCEHDGLIAQQLNIHQEGKLATVLNLDRLMELSGVAYSQAKETIKHPTNSMQASSERETFLLMRTAGLDLAISPQEVESTLAKPEIIPQELSGGYFLGVIDYRGVTIPAIELAQLIDIRHHPKPTNFRAVVLRTAVGAVALLIEEILEIIDIDGSHCLNLPRLPNGRSKALKGLFPNEVLSDKLLSKLQPLTQQHLILSGQEIKQHEDILGLCATYLGEKTKQPNGGELTKPKSDQNTNGKQTTQLRLITYYLEELQASPIDQVVEVLPFDTTIQFLEPAFNQSLMGLISNRGRTLPVFDLGLLKYGRVSNYTSESAILVIHHEQAPIGLAVERLHSIEKASWLVEVPLISQAERPLYKSDRLLHKRAELKLERQTVMVDVIDLLEAISWAYQSESTQVNPLKEPPANLPGISQTSGDTINTKMYTA